MHPVLPSCKAAVCDSFPRLPSLSRSIKEDSNRESSSPGLNALCAPFLTLGGPLIGRKCFRTHCAKEENRLTALRVLHPQPLASLHAPSLSPRAPTLTFLSVCCCTMWAFLGAIRRPPFLKFPHRQGPAVCLPLCLEFAPPLRRVQAGTRRGGAVDFYLSFKVILGKTKKNFYFFIEL